MRKDKSVLSVLLAFLILLSGCLSHNRTLSKFCVVEENLEGLLPVHQLSFSVSGKYLAVNQFQEKGFTLYECIENKFLMVGQLIDKQYSNIVWSPDYDSLFAATHNSGVDIFQLKPLTLIGTIPSTRKHPPIINWGDESESLYVSEALGTTDTTDLLFKEYLLADMKQIDEKYDEREHWGGVVNICPNPMNPKEFLLQDLGGFYFMDDASITRLPMDISTISYSRMGWVDGETSFVLFLKSLTSEEGSLVSEPMLRLYKGADAVSDYALPDEYSWDSSILTESFYSYEEKTLVLLIDNQNVLLLNIEKGLPKVQDSIRLPESVDLWRITNWPGSGFLVAYSTDDMIFIPVNQQQ